MAQPVSLTKLRIAARLGNGFILDLVKLGSPGREVIDPLLRTAVMHANQAAIIRDPELQRRYAGFDTDVPDELRRPASISAMSASLKIPYETARRRLTAMAEAGGLVITGDGVMTLQAVTSSPFFRIACQIQYEMVRTLYGRLRDAGALPPPAAPTPPFEGPEPPLRLVGRLVVEYVLRFNEPIAEHIGDPVTGLVLMDMLDLNTASLDDAEGGGETPGPVGFVPDARRRPATLVELSKRLGIAHETVRRHAMTLAERGLCRKMGRGYIIPAEGLARQPFLQMMQDNLMNLNRMFSGLADFGVVAAWELELQGRAA